MGYFDAFRLCISSDWTLSSDEWVACYFNNTKAYCETVEVLVFSCWSSRTIKLGLVWSVLRMVKVNTWLMYWASGKVGIWSAWTASVTYPF